MDAATLPLAIHEAAHMVAATLVGLPWEHATIVPTDDMAGHVVFHHKGDLDPALNAFVYWAGPAAEARVTGQKLSSVLSDFSASHDLTVFGRYYSRANEKVWTTVLGAIWPSIEQCAARLLLLGTIKPTTPDPLADPAVVSAFVAASLSPSPGRSDWSRPAQGRDPIEGEPDAA